MAKHARIRREREAREQAAAEELERGPIPAIQAKHRARVRRIAGVGSGTWAFGSRVRREVKQKSVFGRRP